MRSRPQASINKISLNPSYTKFYSNHKDLEITPAYAVIYVLDTLRPVHGPYFVDDILECDKSCCVLIKIPLFFFWSSRYNMNVYVHVSVYFYVYVYILCGFICISLCRSIKIKPTNMYMRELTSWNLYIMYGTLFIWFRSMNWLMHRTFDSYAKSAYFGSCTSSFLHHVNKLLLLELTTIFYQRINTFLGKQKVTLVQEVDE